MVQVAGGTNKMAVSKRFLSNMRNIIDLWSYFLHIGEHCGGYWETFIL